MKFSKMTPESRPSKGDFAHAIMMSKCGMHAPKSASGDVSIQALVFDEDQQRTRQDRLDMALF
jgi:hypothetical protein